MKYQFNNITFKNSSKTYQQGENKIVETFDKDMNLLKKIEYDKFDRDIDVKRYDKLGNVSEHMRKEYFETDNKKGYIETFKNDFQEYIRKSYTKIENGFKHVIDDYTSKTSPEKSYINEAIYDLKGKFIKILSLKK